MSDEFDFLHVDKHESSLQIDTMIFGGDCQAFPKFSKQQMSLQYLKKEVKDEVDVLHVDKHQSFYKFTLSFLMEVARHAQSFEVDFNTLGIKVSYKVILSLLMGIIKHFRSTQNITSLQYV